MHIIRASPAYYPYFYLGGSVIADFEIDKALIAEGHSVTVLTCKDNSADPSIEFISPRHKIVRFQGLGKVKHGFSLGVIIEIFKICLKREEEKIIWFGSVWNLIAIMGPIICRYFSQKYVITPHGMLIPSLINMKSRFIKKLCIKLFLTSHLNKAHRVHFTVNEELDQTILATNAKMESVIFPLCFDLSKFDRRPYLHRTQTQDKVVLSFIGRITPKKRIDLIINAIDMLGSEIKSQIKLDIIGTDEEKLWDHENYTEKKIGVEINYKGPLYDEDLVDAYHKTNIFILCSESENFAISVVEAAFCYCVPLITKEVGVSEYFSDTSAVFSSLDAKDMSRNIEKLIKDPDTCKQLSMEARKVSEQFSSEYLDTNYFTKLIG